MLEGTFQQSEFAADITAVRTGKATREYQDAAAFFERTFITEGMRLLLIQVAQRLNGKGGEPVIQLQTAFGGGKTHTMLAVYHLATRNCCPGRSGRHPGAARPGRPDGRAAGPRRGAGRHAHAPGQPWQHGKQSVRTLWGELAWQLGGEEAFALVREADATGTSPGKEVLRDLLARYAPCVVLIDELVAYIRQFSGRPGRSAAARYDSNLSFVQALTEACEARAQRHRPRLPARIGSGSGQPTRRGGAASAGEDLWPRAGAVEAGRHRRSLRDRAPAPV